MPQKAAELPVNPILIGDLPVAEEAALEAFERLPGNIYQNASIGKAYGNDEGTSCDCHFVPGQPLVIPIACLYANIKTNMMSHGCLWHVEPYHRP